MKRLLLILVCGFISIISISAQTISLTPYYPGIIPRGISTTIALPYTSSGATFNSGNTFTAQLSDPTGSFATFTTLGTPVASTATSGTLNYTFTLPAGTPLGLRYRLRIVSSNTALTSSDNNFDFSVNCPVVPAAPTIPACSLRTALPSGGSLSGGVIYGVSYFSGGACVNNTTYSVPTNIVNGNSVTTIYVNSGETLTITGDINSSRTKIYVLAGGTLNLNGDLNAGNEIFLYGTMNHSISGTSRVQSSGTRLYIASSGIYNATTMEVNSSGLIINEGTMNVTTLSQFQNNSAMCVNSNGCVITSSLVTNNVPPSNSLGVLTDNGFGYMLYSGSSCPTPNNNLTIFPSFKICAPNMTGPCTRFGAATVKYSATCTPAPSTCAGVIALPISLSFFKASVSSEGVLTKWGTNSQWNSDHFEIEKSKNGSDWELVGSVLSQNGKGTYREFRMIDPEPYAGESYYRLVEVDTTGKRTIYSTVFIDINGETERFSIYPNPSLETFNVSVSGDYSTYNFEITDLTGKLLGTYILHKGKNEIKHDLSSGTYITKLKVLNDYKIQKLVIK